MAGRYPLYGMAGIDDIFPKNKNYSWIKGDGNLCKIYQTINKHGLCKQVFHLFIKNVLDDIIDNRDILILPLHDASLMVEEIPQKIMDARRSEGKLAHFDEFNAMGKGYNMIYRFKRKGRCIKLRVIVGKVMYDRMVKLVNKGKKYYKPVNIW